MSSNLPTPTLLSCLALAATPTRVRTISARLTDAAAYVYFLLALTLIATTLATASRYTVPVRTLTDLLKLLQLVLTMYWYSSGLAAFCCIAAGTTLLLTSPHIKRAQKKACTLAHLFLLPLVPALMLLTVYLSLFAFAQYADHNSPAALPLFIPAAIAAVFGLLTKDLCANLKWIANNPITEKPPTPFLPIASTPENTPSLAPESKQ